MPTSIVSVPGSSRYLPRSRPGTGPTSSRETTLRAELTHIQAEMEKLAKEQQVQFQRIAEIQMDLDEIKRLLKTIAKQ